MTNMSDADWDWLRAEVRAAATAFAGQLAGVVDGAARVPGLDWDVTELAAHLISMPALYREQNALGDRFEPPASWPEFSLAARAHIAETDLEALGSLLREEAEALLDDLGPDPNAPRRLYGRPTTAGNVAAGFLGELILHGRDLAPLTGATVDFDARQAKAIISQQMALAPAFVDRQRARAATGTFHLRIRGGDEFTYRIEDGVLHIEDGRPKRADAHIVADPVAFVLVSLGRMGNLRAGLLGKIVGYGRKPWLLGRLGRIRVDGV